MNFESFFEEIRNQNINLSFENEYNRKLSFITNDVLFHLPFLAITVLLISKGIRKPKVDEIGQLVGECLQRSIDGFKEFPQHLSWSANLRIRTVKALTFLESANL